MTQAKFAESAVCYDADGTSVVVDQLFIGGENIAVALGNANIGANL